MRPTRERPASAAPPRRRLLAWALSASLGGFVFGYELAVVSGALLFVRSDFGLGGFAQGVLVSVVPLGAMAGGLAAGRVADALGRRRALMLIAGLFIAATVLAATAPSYGVLLVGRAVTGVAVGAVSSTAPLYLSEIAPPEARGRLVTLNQLMISLGIVTAYLVSLAFSGSGSWRAMFAAALVPSAAMLAGMARAPDSPARLGERGPGLRGLARSAARPALLIAVGLAALQQLSAINAVIPYASTIMERTGLGASGSILSSVGVGVAGVIATVLSIRLVDRRGRRPLLLASAAATGISLALLGLTFEVSLGDAGSWLSLLCLLGYVTAFGVGLGPVFWLLIAEIFPPEARAAGAGLATAVNWFTAFAVGLVFVPLADAIGPGPTFWAFAAACAVAFVFVERYVPETKGRTFDEISASLRRPASA
jgi:MFS family permease